MILKMVDGGIVDIDICSYENGHSRCPTCDYGRNRVTDLDIKLTKYTIHVEFQEEKFLYSEAALMLLLLRNVDKIMKYSESHFCQWFKNKVNKYYTRFVMKPIKKETV